ncbi:MAG: tyrosine-type recombinase/integrase [Desulfuromusa sp.]
MSRKRSKLNDFDVENRTVCMVTLKQKKGKKSHRIVRLPPEIFSRILGLRALIFTVKKINPKVSYRVFHRTFQKLAKAAGGDIAWATPHTMRHSCAIRLLKNGVGIEVVQLRLGHASINSTMVYAQLSPQDVEDIIEDAGVL